MFAAFKSYFYFQKLKSAQHLNIFHKKKMASPAKGTSCHSKGPFAIIWFCAKTFTASH